MKRKERNATQEYSGGTRWCVTVGYDSGSPTDHIKIVCQCERTERPKYASELQVDRRPRTKRDVCGLERKERQRLLSEPPLRACTGLSKCGRLIGSRLAPKKLAQSHPQAQIPPASLFLNGCLRSGTAVASTTLEMFCAPSEAHVYYFEYLTEGVRGDTQGRTSSAVEVSHSISKTTPLGFRVPEYEGHEKADVGWLLVLTLARSERDRRNLTAPGNCWPDLRPSSSLPEPRSRTGRRLQKSTAWPIFVDCRSVLAMEDLLGTRGCF